MITIDHWPHAPPHHFQNGKTFIITAGTLHKRKLFDAPEKLDLMRGTTFEFASNYHLSLQAWAFLTNHYHLVASTESCSQSFSFEQFLKHLHRELALRLNELNKTPGTPVMYQYRDTALTFEKSWLARLHYVHTNPVKHRLVRMATDYPWCSAAWFESNASPAFRKTVYSFKTDRINVPDDF